MSAGGSWQTFAELLHEENLALGELGAAALSMTSVLVFGNAAAIEAAERAVEAKRLLHAQAHVRRMLMMKRGFGDLTLVHVCGHAPRFYRRALQSTVREMRVRGISLRITVGNNKALINAGLARIAKTMALMQKSFSEQTGTYRRRGMLTPATGSLIMSRKA